MKNELAEQNSRKLLVKYTSHVCDIKVAFWNYCPNSAETLPD
jgi:hypothetical protein